MLKNIINVFAAVIIVFSLVVSVALAAWTAPVSVPPACNPAIDGEGCNPPLNVGATAQTKTGSLNILGKLGVGTVAPGSALGILGGLMVGSGAGYAANSVAGGSIRLDNDLIFAGGGTNYIQNADIGNIVFRNWNGTANINSLVLHNSGNVGIGTILPAQKLDVNGSIAIPTTIDSTSGVIYKGTARFIHNFALAGTNGFNTFVGLNAGNFTMTGSTMGQGSSNSALGVNALQANTTGYQNSAVGGNALFSNTTGGYNSALGLQALYSNTTGYNNTAMGGSTLSYNTAGYNNTAVGGNAGGAITTGNSNTFLGYNAGGLFGSQPQKVDAVNSTALGNNTYTTADNQMIYGDTNIAQHLFQAGNVGIGTLAPAAKLDVNGKAKVGSLQIPTGATAGKVLTSDAAGNATWQPATSPSTSYWGPTALVNPLDAAQGKRPIINMNSDQVVISGKGMGGDGSPANPTSPVLKVIDPTYGNYAAFASNGSGAEFYGRGNVFYAHSDQPAAVGIVGLVYKDNFTDLGETYGAKLISGKVGSYNKGKLGLYATDMNHATAPSLAGRDNQIPQAVLNDVNRGNQYAGWFDGDVNVNGDITANSVGIGISAPHAKLEVNGLGDNNVDIKVNGRIQTGGSTGLGGVWLASDYSGFVGNNAGNIGFWTAGSGWNAFQINKTTGNIGIGTNNPTGRLQLNGGNTVSRFNQWTNDTFLTMNDSVGIALLGSTAGIPFVGSQSNTDFTIRAANSEKVRVTTAGNVGIGTTNPMAKLHIVEPSNGGDTLILDSPDKPNIEFAYNGAKNYTITYAPSADSTFRDGINIGGGTNKSILNISTRNGGTVLVNGNSVQTSDLRLKKNISSIGQTLGKLLLLNGVLYNWKTEQDGSAKHAGVIAQEVEKVFPELVSTDSTGIKSVDYNGMVAPLIESIKEQQAQINELKQQVKDLESRLK